MNEKTRDDQDFFNLLIEETYQSPGQLNSHLDCYSAPAASIAQQVFREQISTSLGAYQKNLKCFRFKSSVGIIDFPQNWGPFSRALFYFDNNENFFYGVYEADHDPFQFCKILSYEKVIFFSEGDKLYIAGFSSNEINQFKRILTLFAPKEIKLAA